MVPRADGRERALSGIVVAAALLALAVVVWLIAREEPARVPVATPTRVDAPDVEPVPAATVSSAREEVRVALASGTHHEARTERRIEVLVLEEPGDRPIARANVEILAGERRSPRAIETSADGLVVLEDIAQGAPFTLVVTRNTGQRIEHECDASESRVVVRMPCRGVIEGRVALPANLSPEGLRVVWSDDSSRWNQARGWHDLDASSTFRFSGLTLEAAYELRVQRLDAAGPQGTLARSEVIVLEAARPYAAVELDVTNLVAVHLQVVDARGTPAPNARFSLWRDPSHSEIDVVAWGTTDSDGAARFLAPAIGAATVCASLDCLDVPAIDGHLAAGVTTELCLVLPEPHALEGTIRDAEGEPVVEADVTALESGVHWPRDEDPEGWVVDGEGWLDESGAFRIDCVPDPLVDVWVPLDQAHGATLLHHHERFHELRAGAEPVQLQLSPRARIVGRVELDPELVVSVECAHRAGNLEFLELDETGHFELLLGPEPEPVNLVFWLAPDVPTIYAGIETRPGETLDLGLLVPRAPIAITGVLRDATGRPLSGGNVHLQLGRDVRSMDATVNDEGRFRFDNVPRCVGRLLAESKGFVATELAFRDPHELEDARIVLVPAARLAGRVVSRSGATLGRMLVTLTAEDGTGECSVRSELDGSFALEAPPGSWRIVVRRLTSWMPFEGPTVELVGGLLREITVELP